MASQGEATRNSLAILSAKRHTGIQRQRRYRTRLCDLSFSFANAAEIELAPAYCSQLQKSCARLVRVRAKGFYHPPFFVLITSPHQKKPDIHTTF